MPSIKIAEVVKWLEEADRVFRTPLVREFLIPILKPILPTFGLTKEQIATLDRRFAQAEERKARARQRARG